MTSKSILTHVGSITLFVLILFQISSCSHVLHQNFHKQKYLKGKLKPSYEEGSEQCIHLLTPDSIRTTQESHEDLKSGEDSETDRINDDLNTTETTSEKVVATSETEHAQIEPEKNSAKAKIELLDEIKKLPVLNSIKERNNPRSYDGQRSIAWFAILGCLGLIALPFAFLIGFWAFVISFVLLTAAGIVLLTGDYDNPFMVIIVLIFFGLLCVAALIALIWFIIWGIIQLIN